MSADIQLPQPWQPIAGAPLDTPIRTAGFGAGDRLPHNYITTLRRGAETGAFAWCPVSFDPPPPFDNYATWREWERQQARQPGGPPMSGDSSFLSSDEGPSRLRRWLCRHGWHYVISDFPPTCYWCGPIWKWNR